MVLGRFSAERIKFTAHSNRFSNPTRNNNKHTFGGIVMLLIEIRKAFAAFVVAVAVVDNLNMYCEYSVIMRMDNKINQNENY